MPKHNLRSVNYEEKEEEPFVYTPKVTTRKIRIRIDANYNVTGKSSGRNYLFHGAGSVQDVDSTDVDYLLSLRQGKGCCGSTEGNTIFELVGE